MYTAIITIAVCILLVIVYITSRSREKISARAALIPEPSVPIVSTDESASFITSPISDSDSNVIPTPKILVSDPPIPVAVSKSFREGESVLVIKKKGKSRPAKVVGERDNRYVVKYPNGTIVRRKNVVRV